MTISQNMETLSDKIARHSEHWKLKYVDVEDVKEFIKKLKYDIKVGCVFKCCKDKMSFVNGKIDKLAGEKLI